MPELPSHLAELLQARDSARTASWQRFVAEHSRLILSVARSLGGSYDAAMDRYAFILQQLERDDFRKLRGYQADPRAKFTTWLVVVCRRLGIDQHRSKHGRIRGGTDVIKLQTRRALSQQLASALELDELSAPERERPDMEVEAREMGDRLAHCLARLPASDRLLIRLRFEDDLTAAQIARVMRVPTPFHVYRKLNRILGDLRVALTFATPAAQKDAGRPLNVK